jgi:hypothetical protein
MENVTAVRIVGRSEDNVISIHNSDMHFYLDQVSLTGASPIMVRGKSAVTNTAVGSTDLLATADHAAAKRTRLSSLAATRRSQCPWHWRWDERQGPVTVISE